MVKRSWSTFCVKMFFFFLLIFSKNADFNKYKYYGYGIGFDAPESFSLSFGNIIFVAEMRSSVHIDNKKKNILILGKNATDGLDDTTLTVENERTINFT